MSQPEDNRDNRLKRRFEEYIQGQRSLLKTGEHSHFIITCKDRTWNVHKAIICPRSGFLARSVKFGKEEAEGKLNLPDDDPEIVALILQFIYEMDYKATSVGYTTEEDTLLSDWVIFKWNDNTLPRRLRTRLATGLAAVTRSGMIQLIDLMKQTFPDLEPNKKGGFTVYYESLGIPVAEKFANLLEQSELTTEVAQTAVSAEPSYDDTFDNRLLIHANLYCIADKYDINGLQELAWSKFEAALPGEYPLEFKVAREAIRFLMDNTPERDTKVRLFIASLLCGDMDTFGRRRFVDDLLDHHPELKDYCLRVIMDEDRPSGWMVTPNVG